MMFLHLSRLYTTLAATETILVFFLAIDDSVSILRHSHFRYMLPGPSQDCSNKQITINNNGGGTAIAENQGTVNNYASRQEYNQSKNFKRDTRDQLTEIFLIRPSIPSSSDRRIPDGQD